MKVLKPIILATFLIFSFGFKVDREAKYAGVFGVSKNDPSQIELRINPDKTFSFQNFCNPKKKIKTQGNWELKNNTIILTNFTSEHAFHTKWKLEADGKAIKSRKGLNFWRLARLDENL